MANTLESLGRFAHFQGSPDEAYSLVRESVALARKVADKENLARLLYTLVTIEIAQGKMEQAEHSAWESYTLARDAGKKPLIALTLDGLANIAFSQKEYENAVELYERRIQLAQELNDYSTIASKRLKLGEIALKQKNVDIAENFVQESLAFFRAQSDKPNIALALCQLGDIKRIQKDFDQSTSFYRETLVLEQHIGVKEDIGRCLIGLSQNFLEQDMPEQTAKLLGFASTYLGSPEKVIYPSLASEYRLTLERTLVLLGRQTFDTLWSCGSRITYEDILRNDRDLTSDFDSQRHPERFKTDSSVVSQSVPSTLFLVGVVRAFLEKDKIAFVNERYSVQAGISQDRSTMSQEEGVAFPFPNVAESILFNASFHTSQNVELTTDWYKSFSYDPRDSEHQFVEFAFQVTAPGPSFLVIDFYQERRWFRTARIEFNAIEKSLLSSVATEG